MNECEEQCKLIYCYNRGQALDWNDDCPDCFKCDSKYANCMRICVDKNVGIQKIAPDTD